MERFPSDNVEPMQIAEPRQFHPSGARWRALVLAIVLGFSLSVLFVGRWLPAYSDDGPEPEENAFDSPLLIWKYPAGDETLLHSSKSTPGDLLTNGDMDQEGFYWRYPNHWLAGSWFEWFSTRLLIPEFNDGYERGFSHSYPSSQRLQLWGASYAGGLMQSATVTPCAYYQFQAYGQSRPGSDNPPPADVASHMKIGIEPYGWMSGRTIPVYDPGLEPEEFPDTVIWSPEATHNFVYEPYNVTAEALSSAVTVILFSNPEVDLERGVFWNDTIWDTASLAQVLPPSGSILEGGDLPQPDGLISNLSAKALPRLTIVEWDTSVPASTQLLYRVLEPSEPVSVTEPLTYSFYMPLVAASIDRSALSGHSPPDAKLVRHHRVAIAGLPDDYIIDFVALSRRLEGQSCVTSASRVARAVSAGESYASYLPTLVRGE